MERLVAKLETEHSENPGIATAVSLDGVEFAFRRSSGGFTPILRSLTLRLEYGQVVGVVGRNGAGKTTLLNVIRGELVPQVGTVTVGGLTVSSYGHRVGRPSVSLVSQRPDVSLAPSMTVYENFVLATHSSALDLKSAYKRALEDACRNLLARANIGLETRLKEQVRFLSNGQQQALSILLALRSPERVLLMDEPTASLDPPTAESLFEMALREAQSSRALAVIVSHRLQDLVRRCQRILVVTGGRIVMDIGPHDGNWNEQALFRMLVCEDESPS